MKSNKTAPENVNPQKTLSTESSSRLSKRTKRFIREEIQKEVAKQLLSMQRPGTPTPPTTKEIQKVYAQARRQYPKRQGALMMEWYDRFLPIFRILVSNRKVSVDQLRNRKELNAEAVQRLHMLDPSSVIKKLKRFALCKSEEAQARFLARATVGNVFWLSLSHSESLMRNLLSKRNKV